LPEYREALRDALRAGRFRNRLPDDEDQAVPKLFLRAQRFLGALRRGTLLEEYKFDERWLKKHNFDFSIFAEADIPRLVHQAARRYAMMREEGYWPPVKNALTRDIDVFFFHPETRKSMFLYCVFNPARPLEESSGNRKGDAGVPLSEEEREDILGHMRPGWDEAQYLGKAADLLAWYRENGEAIEVYNYYVRNQSGPWSEHFSSFGSLLDTIDHFARRWKSWTLGNFGRGNRTWASFVAWCRNTYSIELEPPPDGMKVALGMREQSLREAKARREEEIARKREEEQVPDAEDVEGEGFTYEEPIVVDPRW